MRRHDAGADRQAETKTVRPGREEWLEEPFLGLGRSALSITSAKASSAPLAWACEGPADLRPVVVRPTFCDLKRVASSIERHGTYVHLDPGPVSSHMTTEKMIGPIRRIAVVDDEPAVRKSLMRLLEFADAELVRSAAPTIPKISPA